jgi:hypothetical protein
MLSTRLVRLIETHSEALSRALAAEIRASERTSDFREIPEHELQLGAIELYRHVGEWLLQKTEDDIARRFKAIAARRAAQGIRLQQFVWAMMMTRDQMLRFLRREAFADNIVALHSELELRQLLYQFFDRGIYYAVVGYEEAESRDMHSNLRRVQELATSIGLMEERRAESNYAGV